MTKPAPPTQGQNNQEVPAQLICLDDEEFQTFQDQKFQEAQDVTELEPNKKNETSCLSLARERVVYHRKPVTKSQKLYPIWCSFGRFRCGFCGVEYPENVLDSHGVTCRGHEGTCVRSEETASLSLWEHLGTNSAG